MNKYRTTLIDCQSEHEHVRRKPLAESGASTVKIAVRFDRQEFETLKHRFIAYVQTMDGHPDFTLDTALEEFYEELVLRCCHVDIL